VIPVDWRPRAVPLPVVAVAARGEPALRLVERATPRFRGIGGPGWLVLLGDELPWVDGAVYLGRDPDAPRLLLPTHSAPHAGGAPVAGLVDRWAADRCAGMPGPYAVIPGWGVIPVGEARAVDPGQLSVVR
jgi:MoxR-vWA-beta-propeller ternary system domain bpX5